MFELVAQANVSGAWWWVAAAYVIVLGGVAVYAYLLGRRLERAEQRLHDLT